MWVNSWGIRSLHVARYAPIVSAPVPSTGVLLHPALHGVPPCLAVSTGLHSFPLPSIGPFVGNVCYGEMARWSPVSSLCAHLCHPPTAHLL